MTLILGGLGFWTLIDLFLMSGMLNKQNAALESTIISEVKLLKNAKNLELQQ